MPKCTTGTYYKYLDILKYITGESKKTNESFYSYSKETRHYWNEEKDEIEEYHVESVSILLSNNYEEEIEKFIESNIDFEESAKNEVIKNFFSISDEMNKFKYLQFISQDFIKLYESFLDTSEKILPLLENPTLATVDCKEVVSSDIFKKYLKDTVPNSMISWIEFLKQLTDSLAIAETDDLINFQSILSEMGNRLKLNKKSLIHIAENINRINLKEYFKSPELYNWMMTQPEVNTLIDANGYAKIGTNKNKQKQELSCLLHFLNSYKFLLKEYTPTTELSKLGYDLFNLSKSLMTKSQGKDINKFIPLLKKLKEDLQ